MGSAAITAGIQTALETELQIKCSALLPEARNKLQDALDEVAQNERLHSRLSELLTLGCDDRIVVNPKTGMHKYNGTNCPVPNSVCRSSCTFNIPTEDVFQVGAAALRHLDMNAGPAESIHRECCKRMRQVWSISAGESITMFPSGTDAEYLPLLIALGRALQSGDGSRVASIVTCAGEVGSGTKNASIGLHFSSLQPTGSTHKPGTSIFAPDKVPGIDAIELKLRTPEGMRHEIESLDNIVSDAVHKAIEVDGYSIAVVHLVAGSKTGRLMPSVQCIMSLVAKLGDRIVPVADACQVRMADQGVRGLLEAGFVVLVTGSKFYGGPPFCGAALLPESLTCELDTALASDVCGFRSLVQTSALKDYINASLVAPELPNLKNLLPETAPNLGLLLRWHMSLYSIESYHKIPTGERDRICQKWVSQVADIFIAKAFRTISVKDDPSAGSTKKLRQRNTIIVSEEAHMMPVLTIILLDLSRLDANGELILLNLEELKKIHSLMATDLSGVDSLPKSNVLARRFFLAQPVTLCAKVHVLRMAIGAPLVQRLHRCACQGLGDEVFEEVRREDEALFEKMDLLLRHYFLECS